MYIRETDNVFALLRSMVLSRMAGDTEPSTGWTSNLTNYLSADLVQRLQLTEDEQLVLTMAYLPVSNPEFFDLLIAEVLPEGGEFVEFGGVRGQQFRGFIPTISTALFLLAGKNAEARANAYSIFLPGATLYKKGILLPDDHRPGEPITSSRLILSSDFSTLLLTGAMPAVQFGPDFPAKHITTRMEWEDLVLHPTTSDLINDVRIWMNFHEQAHSDPILSRKLKPGYKALFHGPSGTGKTLTAMLLGKHFSKEVYRIDLSQIVSKYIGETEKNLERIFQKAEHTNWILFFDEADSLFGKRSGVQSSHDKYANQEVSYLLQRIEDFSGLIILASNFKNNIDPAFIRRFHSIIHFPMPDAAYRLELWQKSSPGNTPYAAGVKLDEIAQRYELTGASILNIVHYSALKTISSNRKEIMHEDLMEGIRKELQKEDKFFLEN